MLLAKQIAIYGKGGIGKSTMSANISAALAYQGYNVMQIGCDPKKDSVKLLLGEQKTISILEYLQDHNAVSEQDIDVIIKNGYKGVKCVESGGPEPGVGCAGRGIILSIETLKKLGIYEWDLDYIIYDVLGDVVCGGFAVPIREGYAQEIYLVVSGEFMSIFAANNICKCIRNYSDTGNVRLQGIILNSRNIPREEELVGQFAEAVNTKVVAVIPRDNRFYKAEIEKKTVVEMYEGSDLSQLFVNFTKTVNSEKPSIIPKPLSDDEIYNMYNNIENKGGV